MASPQRSYVVKSNEDLDYKLAFRKNPTKFIEDTLSKPILKYKIQRENDSYSPPRDRDSMAGSALGVAKTKTGGKKRRKKRDFEVYTIESKRAPRPHQKIGQKIKDKIETKLKDTVG